MNLSALIENRMESLKAIKAEKKSGNEAFHFNGKELPIHLRAFWQWSCSDLVGNALRGMLAEYLVAYALDCDHSVRKEWDAYDIQTKEGIKVEVKSGAYLQSWSQNKLSNIMFGIQPTRGWDAKTNTYSSEVARQSDVYVFCVLHHKDKTTIDPLNINQWSFFILTTNALNKTAGNQKTITLSSLKRLNPIEANFGEIGSAIKQALHIRS